MEQVTEKRCSKCGEVKPLEMFSNSVKGKYGHKSNCKHCDRVRDQERYVENHERLKAASAKWRKENLEKARGYAAKWRKENRERVNAYAAKWDAKNPEKVKAMSANWRKKGRDVLSDSYVSNSLGIALKNCPQQLIELKREQLMLHRVTKQLITTIKESQNAK